MTDEPITGEGEYTPDPNKPDQLAGTFRFRMNREDAGFLVQAVRDGVAAPTKVALQRSSAQQTPDQPLWSAIRNRTDAISFNRYNEFINRVLGTGRDDSLASGYGLPSIGERRRAFLGPRLSIHGPDAYNLLKLATEAFLIYECGVKVDPPRNKDTGRLPGPDDAARTEKIPGETGRIDPVPTYKQVEALLKQHLATSTHPNVLPYLDKVIKALVDTEAYLPYQEGILHDRLTSPSLLELIWSYWHEQGMLVQTIHAIALRFQNRRSSARDPLAHLDIDPLRPLNLLIWGFIQDEYTRLSVPRRAYEYDHQYGLTLLGKAVPSLKSVDSRSKFLEAFHNLLYRAAVFFREDADTTVISDGFPLLNALKEVHLLLAEGAHNQFGDLPWTARVEMLIMQWLLSRPEIREFLRGRAMVPYREPWMSQVDTMKRLQGWTDVTITHFRDLGAFGEQILLSIRYGDWIDVNDEDQARNWARYWKPEIQGYIHAYLAATGVDLMTDTADTREAANRYLQPAVLLRNRLAAQNGRGLPPASRHAQPALEAEMKDSLQMPAFPRQRSLRPSRDG
jgi:hypothetical protein